MEIKINFMKKHLYLIIALVVILAGLVFVTALWDTTKTLHHDGADVKVGIDNDGDGLIDEDYSLQEAITAGLIGGGGAGGGLWDQTGTNLHYTAGNVGIGIGMVNPTTALDVNGIVTATEFVGGGSGLTGISTGNAKACSGDAVCEVENALKSSSGILELSGSGWGMNFEIDTDTGSNDYYKWFSDNVQIMDLEGNTGKLHVAGDLQVDGDLIGGNIAGGDSITDGDVVYLPSRTVADGRPFACDANTEGAIYACKYISTLRRTVVCLCTQRKHESWGWWMLHNIDAGCPCGN